MVGELSIPKAQLFIPNQAVFRIDTHVHSGYSDGTLTVGKLARLGAQRGLQVMFLTDHELSPSQKILDLAQKGLQSTPWEGQIDVNPGAEVSFWHNGQEGHASILASPTANLGVLTRKIVYLRHKDPNLDYVVHWARDNGFGLVMNHPEQTLLKGFRFDTVEDAMLQTKYQGAVGLEVITGSTRIFFPTPFRVTHGQGLAAAKRNGLAPMAASDSHGPESLGYVYTVVFANGPLKTPEDRFKSILVSMIQGDTYPRNDLGRLPLSYLYKQRATMLINELAKIAGIHIDPATSKLDHFRGARKFYRWTGQMTDADYREIMELKLEEEELRRALSKQIKSRKSQTVMAT